MGNPKLDSLVGQLRNPFPWIREKTIKELISMRTEHDNIIEALIEFIRAEKKKRDAASFSGDLEDTRDGKNTPLILAMKALLGLGPTIIPVICQKTLDEANRSGAAALTDSSLPTTVEWELIDVLRQFNSPTFEYLASQIKSDKGPLRTMDAQWLLMHIRPENDLALEALTYSLRVLGSKGAAWRIRVIEVIERIQPKSPQHSRAIQIIADLIANDPDEGVRVAGMEALVFRNLRPKPETAVALFITKLKDKSSLVRAAAARVLRSKDLWPASTEALTALKDAVNDQEENVRFDASWTLRELEKPNKH